MNIIFMGTPGFSLPTLNSIYNSGHNLAAVVTQPDRPKGRGKKLAMSPVKEWALEKNVRVLQPLKARDSEFISTLNGIAPDLIITAAYGQIVPKSILEIPRLGCINVHASLLPQYRGASPIQQAIIDGKKSTGITIMYMDEHMDTGDIIIKEEIEIYENEQADSLHDRLSELGGIMTQKAIKMFENGSPQGIKQNDLAATYCSKIEKSMGNIDWSKSAESINNIIRGLNPWPGTYTFYNGTRLKIKKTSIYENTINIKNKKAGEVVISNKESGLVIACGQGCIKIEELQAPGKKTVSSSVYLLGHTINIGELFKME